MAEHTAVLAALERIAALEGQSSSDIIRTALREIIRDRMESEPLRTEVRAIVESFAPQPIRKFKTPAQAARFKRRLREYDSLLLELGLEDPSTVQNRNSLHSHENRPVLIGSL